MNPRGPGVFVQSPQSASARRKYAPQKAMQGGVPHTQPTSQSQDLPPAVFDTGAAASVINSGQAEDLHIEMSGRSTTILAVQNEGDTTTSEKM